MNIFRPFIEPALRVAKVAFCIGLFAAGWHLGSRHVQVKWDAEQLAAEAQAENNRLLRQSAVNQTGRRFAERAAKERVELIS